MIDSSCRTPKFTPNAVLSWRIEQGQLDLCIMFVHEQLLRPGLLRGMLREGACSVYVARRSSNIVDHTFVLLTDLSSFIFTRGVQDNAQGDLCEFQLGNSTH